MLLSLGILLMPLVKLHVLSTEKAVGLTTHILLRHVSRSKQWSTCNKNISWECAAAEGPKVEPVASQPASYPDKWAKLIWPLQNIEERNERDKSWLVRMYYTLTSVSVTLLRLPSLGRSRHAQGQYIFQGPCRKLIFNFPHLPHFRLFPEIVHGLDIFDKLGFLPTYVMDHGKHKELD